MESLDNPDDRAAGLLALRTVAEAYGGLGAVAAEAGISRESLYRTLSAKGNPTLKTLLAVLKAVGMKLSVEPEHHAEIVLRERPANATEIFDALVGLPQDLIAENRKDTPPQQRESL